MIADAVRSFLPHFLLTNMPTIGKITSIVLCTSPDVQFLLCSIAGFSPAAPPAAPPDRKAMLDGMEDMSHTMGQAPAPPGPPHPMGLGGSPGMMPFGRPPMLGGMGPPFAGMPGFALESCFPKHSLLSKITEGPAFESTQSSLQLPSALIAKS